MSKQVATQIATEAEKDLAVRSGARHGSEFVSDSIASTLVDSVFMTMTADTWMGMGFASNSRGTQRILEEKERSCPTLER